MLRTCGGRGINSRPPGDTPTTLCPGHRGDGRSNPATTISSGQLNPGGSLISNGLTAYSLPDKLSSKMRRKQLYTRKITVALTEAQRDSLETTANTFGCDLSDIVREAVEMICQRGGRLEHFEQCSCGGWRPQTFSEGKWVWSAGCRACDEIARLRKLSDAGVSVSEGETAETLRGKLRLAEQEIERLRYDYRSTLEDIGVDKEDQDKRLFLAHCPFPGREP